MHKKKILISIGAIISICVVLLAVSPKIKELIAKNGSNEISNVITKEQYKEMYRDVVNLYDMGVYDYKGITEEAAVIALVEVLDNLTPENSEGIIDTRVSNEIYGWIGRREVKVLQYFKDERNYGDMITINEGAAIDDEGNYIHPEGYETLIKGEKYILFLSDECFTKQLSTIACQNSVVHVDNLNENEEFYDVQIKAIIDLLSDLSEKEKKEIINADIEKADKDITKISDKKVTIKVGREKKEIYIKKGNNGKLDVGNSDQKNQNNQGQNAQGNKNQNQQ